MITDLTGYSTNQLALTAAVRKERRRVSMMMISILIFLFLSKKNRIYFQYKKKLGQTGQ